MTLLLRALTVAVLMAPVFVPPDNDVGATVSFTDLAYEDCMSAPVREHWLTRAWTLRHTEPVNAQADLAAEVETWLTETQLEGVTLPDFAWSVLQQGIERVDWGDVARRIEQESVADEWARRAPGAE